MAPSKLRSEELRAGRRALDELPWVRILADWTWWDFGFWVLHCQLELDLTSTEVVPRTTNWYVLASEDYPWGNIHFFPAVEGGLKQTFPHQAFNGLDSNKIPWRKGGLCLSTGLKALDRLVTNQEPSGAHQRLKWYFSRAKEWLHAASEGKLAIPDDFFELPPLPCLAASKTLAFAENPASFFLWQSISDSVGAVNLLRLQDKPGIYYVREFQSMKNRLLYKPSWGRGLTSIQQKPMIGIWMRLEKIPIIAPWQFPATWGELRAACSAQNIDFDVLLRKAFTLIRDRRPHIALLGFPVPQKNEGPDHQLHWLAFKLPSVLSGKQAKPLGFAPKGPGDWQWNRCGILKNDDLLEWIATENWDMGEISTRGRLSEAMRTPKILLIGAGAVGSVLAELLVRSGSYHLTIIDGDTLEIGNLTRHTLGLEYLKSPKTLALVQKLNAASPHALVTGVPQAFPPSPKHTEFHTEIQSCDVIIDCTASEELLHHLEKYPWEQPKLFLSISLGLRARKLFCFAAHGKSFPLATFQQMLRPWLRQDQDNYRNLDFPREGIGCWHPVFPARIDDVWLMVSTAIKQIEVDMDSPQKDPKLTIFEQMWTNNEYMGVQRLPYEALYV